MVWLDFSIVSKYSTMKIVILILALVGLVTCSEVSSETPITNSTTIRVSGGGKLAEMGTFLLDVSTIHRLKETNFHYFFCQTEKTRT